VVLCISLFYKDLNVTIEGKAEVEIAERHSHTSAGPKGRSHTTYHTEYYRAKEIYISSVIPILGEARLPKGRTVFPFNYVLSASNLPCTFQATHGSVKYSIFAHMKGSLFQFDIRETIYFVVGPFLDLSRVRLDDLRQTTFAEESPVVGCCSCFKAPESIRLQLIVPKRYFIPGEFIRFHMTIENKCPHKLLSGVMQFVQLVRCFAQGTMRVSENVYAQIAGPEVQPGCTQNWQVDNLRIPVIQPVGIPPTDLGGCNIIKVGYGLRVLGIFCVSK